AKPVPPSRAGRATTPIRRPRNRDGRGDGRTSGSANGGGPPGDPQRRRPQDGEEREEHVPGDLAVEPDHERRMGRPKGKAHGPPERPFRTDRPTTGGGLEPPASVELRREVHESPGRTGRAVERSLLDPER